MSWLEGWHWQILVSLIIGIGGMLYFARVLQGASGNCGNPPFTGEIPLDEDEVKYVDLGPGLPPKLRLELEAPDEIQIQLWEKELAKVCGELFEIQDLHNLVGAPLVAVYDKMCVPERVKLAGRRQELYYLLGPERVIAMDDKFKEIGPPLKTDELK